MRIAPTSLLRSLGLVVLGCGQAAPPRGVAIADAAPEAAPIATVPGMSLSGDLRDPGEDCAAIALPADAIDVQCVSEGADRGWAVVLTPLRQRTKANTELSFIAWDARGQARHLHGPVIAHVLDVPELVDLQEDGASELLVTVDRQFLLRFDGTTITEVPRPTGTILGFVDIDGDRRPDPVYRDDVGRVQGCAGVEQLVFEQPAHTLPDGTITHDDAVIRKALRDMCGPRGAFAFAERSPVEAARCARVQGHTEAAVIQAVLDACPARGGKTCDDPCASFDLMMAAAAHAPWVTLSSP